MNEMRVLVGCWFCLVLSGCAATPSCATAPTRTEELTAHPIARPAPVSDLNFAPEDSAKAPEPSSAVEAKEAPATVAPATEASITGSTFSNSTGSPSPDPLAGMTPEQVAQWIADQLVAGEEMPSGQSLPVPRSASDNNPFALVRSATDIAANELPFVASPDGKRFAFLPPNGSEHPQLWLANRDGSGARQLVDLATTEAALAEGAVGQIRSPSLFSPSFSPDGKKIYFMTDGWATSLALYSVDTKSLKTTFVSDANGYHVIDQCRDKSLVGSLVAYRHSYSEMLSAVDWYFLLDAAGKPRGVIGPEPDSVARFMANRCGAAVPAPESIPKLLLKRPGCNGMVLRYEPKRFLDGTQLQLFYWVNEHDAIRPLDSIDTEAPYPMGVDEATSALWEQCGLE